MMDLVDAYAMFENGQLARTVMLLALGVVSFVCSLLGASSYWVSQEKHWRPYVVIDKGSKKTNSNGDETMLLSKDRIDMIVNRKWKMVLEWVVFSPHEVSLSDKNGHTILHHLCLFRAPVEIIQTVLWQEPSLAAQPNKDGEVPLHWAVRLSASQECMRSLLKASRVSGSAFRDSEGYTPLSLLWDRCNSKIMEAWWEDREKLVSLASWKRTMLFFQPSEDEDASPSPLHAAAQTSCPPALFPLMIKVYQDQLCVCDAHGRNPLQIACSNSVTNRSIDLRTKIQYLLKEDPEAAKNVDKQGRNAFLIALSAGVTWKEGLKELFEQCPSGLTIPDSLTGLSPFMLAGTGATKRFELATELNKQDMLMSCSQKSLATVFRLLRANPCCLELTQ